MKHQRAKVQDHKQSPWQPTKSIRLKQCPLQRTHTQIVQWCKLPPVRPISQSGIGVQRGVAATSAAPTSPGDLRRAVAADVSASGGAAWARSVRATSQAGAHHVPQWRQQPRRPALDPRRPRPATPGGARGRLAGRLGLASGLAHAAATPPAAAPCPVGRRLQKTSLVVSCPPPFIPFSTFQL